MFDDGPAADDWRALDRLDVEMAILDRDGVIVAVNEAWIRFAHENGGERALCCEGASYLAACLADPRPDSVLMAAAIRAAAAGELLAPITLESACHAPHEARWFNVTVGARRDPAGEPDGAFVSFAPAVLPPAGRDRPRRSSGLMPTPPSTSPSTPLPVGPAPVAGSAAPPAPASGIGPALSLPGPGPTRFAAAELHELIDASPDGLALVDRTGQFQFTNRAFDSLFGYGRGELLGRAVELLVPSGVTRAHRAHRLRFRAEGTPRQMAPGLDVLGRRRDGSTLPVEITLSPLPLAGGEQVVVAVRHQTFALDAALEQRVAARALDLVGEPVFVFDETTLAYTYANRAAALQLGYDRRQLMSGMTPIHVTPELTVEALRSVLAAMARDERPIATLPAVHLTRDGVRLPVELTLQRITAVGGRTHVLVVANPRT